MFLQIFLVNINIGRIERVNPETGIHSVYWDLQMHNILNVFRLPLFLFIID